VLGKKAVDLVKLIGDPILLIKGHASPGVTQRDGEMSVPRGRGDAHLASVCELDGIANEVEQHLCKALFVSDANSKRLVRTSST